MSISIMFFASKKILLFVCSLTCIYTHICIGKNNSRVYRLATQVWRRYRNCNDYQLIIDDGLQGSNSYPSVPKTFIVVRPCSFRIIIGNGTMLSFLITLLYVCMCVFVYLHVHTCMHAHIRVCVGWLSGQTKLFKTV